MGSHAIGTARLLERQISNLLVRRLLCASPSETTVEERIHNELHHLLWSEQTQEKALRFGKKLFIMLAASVMVGSALEGTISLASLIPHVDGNNCDSFGVHNPECNPHYIEDTRRMGLGIGVATGLMMFTVLVIGAMIVAISRPVAGGYHRGEEAFLALVWLTNWRRHVADLQEWLLESSRQQSALISTPIRSFTSTSSSTSSTGTRPFPSNPTADPRSSVRVEEDTAVAMARRLGDIQIPPRSLPGAVEIVSFVDLEAQMIRESGSMDCRIGGAH